MSLRCQLERGTLSAAATRHCFFFNHVSWLVFNCCSVSSSPQALWLSSASLLWRSFRSCNHFTKNSFLLNFLAWAPISPALLLAVPLLIEIRSVAVPFRLGSSGCDGRCCRYQFTAEDVQAMVEQKRAAGAGGFSAAERARQRNLLTAAQESGNMEEVERYSPFFPPTPPPPLPPIPGTPLPPIPGPANAHVLHLYRPKPPRRAAAWRRSSGTDPSSLSPLPPHSWP